MTQEDCIFGIIEKASYEESLKEVIDKQKKETIEFLVSTKIFGNFDTQLLIKIFSNFVLEKIEKNSNLIEEGNKPFFIYFIKTGDFEINIKNSIIEINKKIHYLGGDNGNDIQDQDLRFKSI